MHVFLLDPVEGDVNALRQSCVFILRQMKAFPQGVQASLTASSTLSWADCAVHLLTRLTRTHENEARTVVHSLPVLVHLYTHYT